MISTIKKCNKIKEVKKVFGCFMPFLKLLLIYASSIGL